MTSGEYMCATEVAKLCTLAVRYPLFFGKYVATSRETVIGNRILEVEAIRQRHPLRRYIVKLMQLWFRVSVTYKGHLSAGCEWPRFCRHDPTGEKMNLHLSEISQKRRYRETLRF